MLLPACIILPICLGAALFRNIGSLKSGRRLTKNLARVPSHGYSLFSPKPPKVAESAQIALKSPQFSVTLSNAIETSRRDVTTRINILQVVKAETYVPLAKALSSRFNCAVDVYVIPKAASSTRGDSKADLKNTDRTEFVLYKRIDGLTEVYRYASEMEKRFNVKSDSSKYPTGQVTSKVAAPSQAKSQAEKPMSANRTVSSQAQSQVNMKLASNRAVPSRAKSQVKMEMVSNSEAFFALAIILVLIFFSSFWW